MYINDIAMIHLFYTFIHHSFFPLLFLPRLFSLISLAMIAFGTGGIKPCVSAFGGDQFVAGQEAQLKSFFAIFYMAINSGSLMSTLLTPMFRGDVSCSARGDCFPLAFGVPATLMAVALALFIAGKSYYRIVGVAEGNVIFKYFQCNMVRHESIQKFSYLCILHLFHGLLSIVN